MEKQVLRYTSYVSYISTISVLSVEKFKDAHILEL